MSWTGQPTPVTVKYGGGGKVSDGKSVKVAVPESTKIVAGKFYLLGGFLGCAMQSVTTGAGKTAEVVLSVEPAEYETDQIKEAEKGSMIVGADIYWDDGVSEKYFTVTATEIYAGKITVAADNNNVIWFKLAERPFALDDVTTLSGQVGDIGALDLDPAITPSASSVVDALNKVDGKVGKLGDLETTAQSSVVGAINEVVEEVIGDLSDLDPAPLAATTVVGVFNEKVAAKVDAIADVESLVVTDADDLKAVATKLNELISALTTAGLMSDSE